MKKIFRNLLCLTLATVVVLTPLSAHAVTIAELQEEIRRNQSMLDNVTGSISGLEDQQDVVEEEIADLDAELINLYTEIGVLEDQIAEKEENIASKEIDIQQAQKEYDAAKAEEDRQYAAMKIRIKYLYEEGNASYVELLMTSGSFGDMLNKFQYSENLYDYDRKMIVKFQKIEEQVAALKAGLEDEKAALEAEKTSLESDKKALAAQQEYLNGILDQKKRESANYAAEIAAAKKKAAAYKKQIAADTKKIQQIQEEERRRLAAQGNPTSYTPSANAAATVASAKQLIAKSNGSELGKKIASYGVQFVGNPYVAGGTSLTNGADCSGFVFRIYADFGYRIPRTSFQLRSAGKSVSYAEAQPGDLICYEGHVAMYIGGGMIVHASSAKTGIKISNAQYKPILAVRRII